MNSILRVLFVALLILVVATAMTSARKLTLLNNETIDIIDPLSGSGATWKMFVSLYCRGLYTPLSYGITGGKYDNDLAEYLTKEGDALRVKIKEDAYFYQIYKHPITGKVERDSARVTANDVVVSYRNLVHDKTEILDHDQRDLLKSLVKEMKVINESEIHVIFKPGKTPYDEKKVLVFPVVPASSVPEGHVVKFPKQPSPMVSYRERPWSAGPFAIRRIHERSGSPTYYFERVWGGSDEAFSEIEWQAETVIKQYIERLRHPNDFLCAPRLPIGRYSDISLRNPDLIFRPVLDGTVHQIVFNTKRAPFDDAYVRAALALLIDRDKLMGIFANEVDLVSGPFPYGFWYACNDCESGFGRTNVDYAYELLGKAGWVQPSGYWEKGGKRLSINLNGFGGSSEGLVGELVNLITNGWENHGIVAKPKILLRGAYDEALRNRDFDASFLETRHGIMGARVDQHFLEGGSENYSGLNDPGVTQLWNKLRNAQSADEIGPLWKELDVKIASLVPSIFLWSPNQKAAYTDYVNVSDHYCPHNFLCRLELWLEQ